jgi:hypothetical protein
VRILVACEESQAVTIALRANGHEAYSCDIVPCSGGHPEWHIQQDAREILGGGWEMMIAFPPCTHLAVSGARWFEQKRADGRQAEGVELFMSFANAPIEKTAIENPVGIMSSVWRKPDQVIQPWQFGHGETKATCLWLRGLPLLRPTNVVAGREARVHRMAPSPRRSVERSKTYAGIAAAMADQWAGRVA